MGRYDNYDNKQRIAIAKKNLEKLEKKRKPDLFKIDMARKTLEAEELFSSCQIFGKTGFWRNGFDPNDRIMFSDDNEALMFGDVLIYYRDIQGCYIGTEYRQIARTNTKTKGGITRAVIGGAIAGPVGAVVGASTARSVSKTEYSSVQDGFKFYIECKDGKGWNMPVDGTGLVADKIPRLWMDVKAKIDAIIEQYREG